MGQQGARLEEVKTSPGFWASLYPRPWGPQCHLVAGSETGGPGSLITESWLPSKLCWTGSYESVVVARRYRRFSGGTTRWGVWRGGSETVGHLRRCTLAPYATCAHLRKKKKSMQCGPPACTWATAFPRWGCSLTPSTQLHCEGYAGQGLADLYPDVGNWSPQSKASTLW
jgi:hypothetical protein